MCQDNLVNKATGKIDVALLRSVSDVFQTAEPRHRLAVERNMKNYADKGLLRSKENFKRQGSFADGNGKKVVVWAFKKFQLRVYGGVVAVGGRPTWVGTVVDLKKKQKKADRKKLEAAARALGRLAACKAGDK